MPTFNDDISEDHGADKEFEEGLDGFAAQEAAFLEQEYAQHELAGDDDYYDPELGMDADYAPPNGGGLRITNPSDLPGGIYQRDDESTPRSTPTTTQHKDNESSYGGSEHSWQPTPSSATPAVELPTDDHREQPNPFLADIPASVPSFDMYPSQRQAPPAIHGLPATPAPLRPHKGRESLPSQQKRHSANILPTMSNLRVANDTSPGPPLPPKEPEDSDVEEWKQEAIMYNDYASGEQAAPAQTERQLAAGKFGSVAGSISRRYDGSAWD